MILGLRTSSLSAAFLFLIMLLPVFQSTTAVSVTACYDCWSEPSPPVYGPLGPYSSFSIPYVNTFNTTAIGIVFMVVHNSLGQTVEISTGVLQLAAGANGTAYTIVFGLASGEYSATFFVTEPSGVAISATTTAAFTV